MSRRALALGVLALVAVACTTSVENPSSTQDSTGVTGNLLHDPGVLAAAMHAIERRVGAEPARITDASVYGEYVIVEAQDPDVPDHIDRYTWRDGEVTGPEPVHLSGTQEDIESALYPTSSVSWRDIPGLVRKAERHLERAVPPRIEEPEASYVVVERSSTLDGRVTIRVSVDGPRRSGWAELTPAGEILNATVS